MFTVNAVAVNAVKRQRPEITWVITYEPQQSTAGNLQEDLPMLAVKRPGTPWVIAYILPQQLEFLSKFLKVFLTLICEGGG